MGGSLDPVTEDLIDPTGKKLVLLKYPTDFDVKQLDKKKLALSLATPSSSSTGKNPKRGLLRIEQEGNAVYTVQSSMDSSAWEIQGLRPLVVNNLTKEPIVGEPFVGCISVIRNYAIKAEEDVDIAISGYKVRHEQIAMGSPKLPFGSSSSDSSAKARKRKVEEKREYAAEKRPTHPSIFG